MRALRKHACSVGKGIENYRGSPTCLGSGEKLGMIGKITDEALIKKMEKLEKSDLTKKKKNKKKVGSGGSKVSQ